MSEKLIKHYKELEECKKLDRIEQINIIRELGKTKSDREVARLLSLHHSTIQNAMKERV